MATITFSIASAAITGSKSFTLSDADIARWVAVEKLRYGTGPQTAAQTLLNWANQCMAEAKERTLSGERDAAAVNVAPITTT